MKTKTRIFAMPSPSGRNAEGLFIRQTILTRDQLGQDSAENLESGTLPSAERGRSSENDPAYEMRLALEKLISNESGQLPEGLLGKILDLLDAHSPHQSDRMARLVVEPRAKDGIPSARERDVSGVQNEGDASDPRGGKEGGGGTVVGGPWREGEDDDIPDFADFARDLKKKGMSRDQIEKAVGLARDHFRRQRAGGRDRLPGRGGHFEKSRFDRSDQAADEIHELLKRFETGGSGHDYAPDRDRFAYDAAPMTERQKDDLFRMFPDMARIGDVFEGDGPSIRDGTYKSRYEV
jgi:hypothetical protein